MKDPKLINRNSLWRRLARLVRNLALDLRFGGRYLNRPVNNADEVRGYLSTQSSDYAALDVLFSKVTLKPDDVIVDIGCGRGRPFNWLLSRKVTNRLIGVDIDEKIAAETRERLKNYSQVEIRVGNVEEGAVPPEGTIFYLFNPFSEKVVDAFQRRLSAMMEERSIRGGDRPLIIYYNANWLRCFENNPRWKVVNLGVITEMQLTAAVISPRPI